MVSIEKRFKEKKLLIIIYIFVYVLIIIYFLIHVLILDCLYLVKSMIPSLLIQYTSLVGLHIIP